MFNIRGRSSFFNSLMHSIRQMVRHLKGWIADMKEKKAALMEALEQAKEPAIPELLSAIRYFKVNLERNGNHVQEERKTDKRKESPHYESEDT